MRRQDDEKANVAAGNIEREPPVRQPYRPPRLTRYGKLREIVLGEKGRARNDRDASPSFTQR